MALMLQRSEPRVVAFETTSPIPDADAECHISASALTNLLEGAAYNLSRVVISLLPQVTNGRSCREAGSCGGKQTKGVYRV